MHVYIIGNTIFHPWDFWRLPRGFFLRTDDIKSMTFRILDNFQRDSIKDKKKVINVTFVLMK